MEAGVVAVAPADQPCLDMVVERELVVGASARGIVEDMLAPFLGSVQQIDGGELQLGSGQVAVGGGTSDHALLPGDLPLETPALDASVFGNSPNRRWTLVVAMTVAARSPSGASSGGSTTGLSEPVTSWSRPTAPAIAPIARRP